jgi:hypothetical protein
MGAAASGGEVDRKPERQPSPAECVVVVALDPRDASNGWGFLEALRPSQLPATNVVLVCPQSLVVASRPPDWIRVIVLPNDVVASEATARRLGAAHAVGDVIRFVPAGDLTSVLRGAAGARPAPLLNVLLEAGVPPVPDR